MLHHHTTVRLDDIRTSARHIVRNLGFMSSHLAGTQLSPSAVHSIIEIGYGTVSNARDLGVLLRLEKSSISRLLKKLESAGLIHIGSGLSDKRIRNLALTSSGTDLLRQIEDYARQQLRSSLAPLSSRELETVEQGLRAFAHALDTEPAATTPDIDVVYKQGYHSGVIANVVALHAVFYSKNYGFGSVFERKVAHEMSEFMGRIDHPQNTTISAYRGDHLLGSVSIDGEDLGDNTAHLRWFIVSPDAQGLGIGKKLLEQATVFVDANGFHQTRLWTFKGLDAARHLYESLGYSLAKEEPGTQWGTQVVEQEFIRIKPV